MSAIRPPAPSPLFPTQAPAPARSARASFFQAALDGLKAAPAGVAAPAPVEASPAALAVAASAAVALERPSRPGGLLDIRV